MVLTRAEHLANCTYCEEESVLHQGANTCLIPCNAPTQYGFILIKFKNSIILIATHVVYSKHVSQVSRICFMYDIKSWHSSIGCLPNGTPLPLQCTTLDQGL